MPSNKKQTNDNTVLVGKKVKAVPKEPQSVGADIDNDFIYELLDAAQTSQIDLNSIDNFSNVSQSRESLYALIDTMAEDDRVSAILETYTEDVTQTNENGQIVWCECDNSDISEHVNYLLDTLNVDKYAYEWVYNLIKYGDLYLQLFRDSDFKEDEDFMDELKSKSKQDNRLDESLDGSKEDLKEDVNVVLHKESDHYRNYVEMVANPGEMFELTKHGKTMTYVQAPTNIQSQFTNQEAYSFMFYKMKQKDINIYGATDFVHACLSNNNSSRSPEEVSIFTNDDDYDAEKNTKANTFKVKRGQSLLYNQFRTWRQLSLLENSVLLNRLTKSAIVELINIDIGDMSKEQATTYVDRLKQKIEQKSAIQVGKSIQEYTNPGPIKNMVYIPSHEGQGTVTATTLGGDYDPKSLTDLDYFQNKFYGNMRVPKQFFNLTDDSTGFNGGSSLTIISSRYGKEVKNIQNVLIQCLTDLINYFLIDRGYTSYINKFKLRMQAPITQEELDKREAAQKQMGIVQDTMSQVNSLIKDDIIKLKVLKTLLSTTYSDPELINLIDEQIKQLEQEKVEKEEKGEPKDKKPKKSEEDNLPPMTRSETPLRGEPSLEEPTLEEPEETGEEEAPTEDEGSYLPSPDELGVDLLGNQ